MRLIIAAIACVASSGAFAETLSFPVSIPQECFELAQREGVPTIIQNKYQATRAKLILARGKNSDHLVRECRAAVHRAQQTYRQEASGTTVVP